MTNTGRSRAARCPRSTWARRTTQPAGIQFAVRQLAAFGRVTLQPGQSQQVTMHVPLRQLQYWSSASQQWITAAGRRTVYAGDADALSSLPLRATVTIPSSGSITCDDTQLSAVMVQGNVLVPAGCLVRHGRQLGGGQRAGQRDRPADRQLHDRRQPGRRRRPRRDDPLSSGANVVCGTTIGGNLVVRSGGRGLAPWNLGQCGANTVKGT